LRPPVPILVAWLLLTPLGCQTDSSNGDDTPGDDDTAPGDDDDSGGDDDSAGDDDTSHGNGNADVYGSVDIITVTIDQEASGVRVFQLDDPDNFSITDADGCWDLDFPDDLDTVMLVAQGDDVEEARFYLDLTWQQDRTEDMIFFNMFKTSEFASFMDKVFGLVPDPERGILEVGAKSIANGPRLAGATIHTDLDYELVVTANDEPAETNVTTDDGTNFFMNIETGMANIWVEGPDGQPCTGLSPVEVVAGALTHVIFRCN
jgi:hypothetical protein